MRHTVEKLNEYGLKFDVDLSELKNFKTNFFKKEQDISLLPIKLSRLLNIIMRDANIFRTKFQIPDKYVGLMDDFICDLLILFFDEGESEVTFATPDYVTELDHYILFWIEKNEEEYLKINKKFKVGSIFNKETAKTVLVKEMVELAENFLIDPATQPARQQLYKDLLPCLVKDRDEFLAAAGKQ